MSENRYPVAATVVAVTALLIAATLPFTVALVLAGLAVAGSWLAVAVVHPLDLPLSPGTAAVRAAAVVLLVIGGPIVAAAELGLRAVPLLMALGAVTILALPLLPGLWGRDVDPDGCGQDPQKVRR
ncbi:hypothetical protein [Pseudonocardia parietis]|uniref:Integral membrane protein n=1 Tax=Pseudonocardia parietis TaxID=570936 RepID=A0ABS4VTN6_9PSEU|nr:hypothetical protein [Pseudonocardia parietis]MBP2367279.1 hypothetical protein [Pseudonocardia parietis]